MTETPLVELEERRGAVAWLASTDHKRIGLLTIGSAFFWFCVAGVLALLIRAELAWPGVQIFSEDAYAQLFTEHGSTMFYHFFGPITFGLAVYLVPLQIGAPKIAAPRLTLAGFWLIFAAPFFMYLGFATGHGAGKDGWYAFWPLQSREFMPGPGQDMWLVSVLTTSTGQLLIAGTLLATIVRYRAPGMTMLRLSPFTWSVLVTCFMTVGSYPMLLVVESMVLGERQGWWSFLDGPHGAEIYQQLFWYWAHPIVYIVFFPFVGAVAESVASLSGKRFFGYKPLVLSFIAFAGLSMAVWQHHMFTTGYVVNQYASLTTTLIAIPASIEYFDTIGTMVGGKLRFKTPLLFSIAFLLQFLIGGLSGIWQASPPLNYHIHDSHQIVAHFHYTLAAGSLFGMFAGLYFWWPKFFGAPLREGIGKLHFWLLAIGTNLTFFPMFFLGVEGMARRVNDYERYEIRDWWLNAVSSGGAVLIALGILAFVVNVWVSLRHKRPEETDWEGHGLEWWTSSPPPPHNFRSLPPIRSYAPVLDLRLEERARARE